MRKLLILLILIFLFLIIPLTIIGEWSTEFYKSEEQMAKITDECTYETAKYYYEARNTRYGCFALCHRAGMIADPLIEENVVQDCRCYTCEDKIDYEKRETCHLIQANTINGLLEYWEECDKFCETFNSEPGKHEVSDIGVACSCCE